MKPIWLGIIFLLVYGLFSMKVQAASLAVTADTVHQSGEPVGVR